MKKELIIIAFVLSLIGFMVNVRSVNLKKSYLKDTEIMGVYINNELSEKIPSKDEAKFYKAICDDGNVSVSWDSETWGLLLKNLTAKTKCNLYFYSGQTVFDFDYTGGEQTFTAPITGPYEVELWGAQGGGDDDKYTGGYGAYSNGVLNISKNTEIFINVGKSGNYCIGEGCVSEIAYNGGGSCKALHGYISNSSCGSGGGATHIAFKSGLLSTLESNKSDILMVSGGGGGANNANYPYNYANGGSGGGFKGNSGVYTGAQDFYVNGAGGKGGTQISGNSFGIGSCNNGYTKVGGGGGYYGGIGSDINGAGGGSGYIGNPLLKDKVMYCYNCEESDEESTKTISTTCSEETPTENCAKKGNGYARITLVSID